MSKTFQAGDPEKMLAILFNEASPGDIIEIQFKTGMPIGVSFFQGDPLNPVWIDGCDIAEFNSGLSIMDCHGLGFRSASILNEINLNDSYPDVGIDGIYLSDLKQKGGSRGIFLGAYNAKRIFVDRCKFGYQVNGTHPIYMSGGHWTSHPEYYCEDIHITRSTIQLNPCGRNGIQFNGRFKNCSVKNNLIRNFQLNAVDATGVQGFEMSGNICYGGNRGTGYVAYDYASHWAPYYNYFQTEKDIEDFLATHWPNRDHRVFNNTIVVGPKAFSKGWGHKDDPTEGHPSVLINNAVHSGFTFWNPDLGKYIDHPGIPFENKNLFVFDNILTAPSTNLVDIYHAQEAKATHLIGNIFYSPKGPAPSTLEYAKSLGALIGNIFQDPGFVKWPDYPFIDLDANPGYNWKEFKVDADLHSNLGAKLKKGAIRFPGKVFTGASTVLNPELAAELLPDALFRSLPKDATPEVD